MSALSEWFFLTITKSKRFGCQLKQLGSKIKCIDLKMLLLQETNVFYCFNATKIALHQRLENNHTLAKSTFHTSSDLNGTIHAFLCINLVDKEPCTNCRNYS